MRNPPASFRQLKLYAIKYFTLCDSCVKYIVLILRLIFYEAWGLERFQMADVAFDVTQDH